MDKRFKIFSGSSNPKLARKVCSLLDVSPGRAQVHRFSDGEVQVEIDDNVRGKEVYVFQSICRPVNEHLMELLVMMDALKRASARRINAVLPYYGYGRQDQKDRPRVSITAKMAADLLTTAGTMHLISIDLHAAQIEGFLEIPVENVAGAGVLSRDFRKWMAGDEVVVAPDAGGVERARAFAEGLGIDLAIMDHRGVDFEPAIVGDVEGRSVIVLDDMVDTGRTLARTAKAAEKAGAASVDALCSHGVLSENAIERIEDSCIRSLTFTDTIPQPERVMQSSKVRCLSVAPLLAEVIKRLECKESISSLFT
jgi:ribose-phosphate pyrophosphokinase